MAAKHRISLLSSLLLATAVLLLASVPAAALGGRRGSRTRDLCIGTDYVTLCHRFVKGVTDPRLATAQLIGVITKETTSAMAKPELQKCRGMYEKVIDDLKTSLQNIKDNDKNALQNNLSAVIANYSSCDDTLTQTGQKRPPSNVNSWLSHMTANCLGLVDQIAL